MDFIDPQTTLLQLGLRDGMKVGDFGAGSGHYALAASAMIDTDGKVYAFDVQEDVVKRLAADAAAKGARNIDCVWANFEKPMSTNLKDDVLDIAILSNTLFQLENKSAALKEIHRVLKPGGKLLVVDWTGSHGGMGPVASALAKEADVRAYLDDAGFTHTKSFTPGPHHYALVVTKHV